MASKIADCLHAVSKQVFLPGAARWFSALRRPGRDLVKSSGVCLWPGHLNMHKIGVDPGN
jgi:hypothetical protein